MDKTKVTRSTSLFVALFFSTQIFAESAPRWTIESVARSASGNRQVAMKMTPDGKIRLAHTGCTDQKCKNNELVYTVKAPNSKWASVVIDNDRDNTGKFPSMEITSDNTLHIFYSNNYQYPILRRISKSITNEENLALGWKKEVIGKTGGGFWIASASNGNELFVANTSFPTNDINNSVMQVVSTSARGWTHEDVDTSWSSGWFNTMAIGKDGLPLASFTQGKYPDGDLMFAKKGTDGKWAITNIDFQSYKPSIAVDEQGYVHMAYTKVDEKFMKPRDLYYATNAPNGEWHTTLIEGGEYKEQDTGLFPKLKLDKKGGIHIVYNDNFHQKVAYARNLGDGWKIFEITHNKQDGYYANMEIDDQGGVHVVYDAGNELRYAFCSDCALH